MKARANIRLPGDKSLTHRALALAALADGESRIENPLTAKDVRSMAAALRCLGIAVSPMRGGTVRVRGKGLRGFDQPATSLHCGNSGTAARLLLGLLAGCPLAVKITGDASLRRRPMRRVTRPLGLMGATVTEFAGDGLPVEIRGGALRPIDHRSEVASAQVKTAILFAGLVARVGVRVWEPVQSRDHTERMLRALGVDVSSNGNTVVLTPTDRIAPFTARIPGDPSSAAFLIAAALLAGRDTCQLEDVALNPTRTGFFEVLKRMGASVEVTETAREMGEPVGWVRVERGRLTATTVDPVEIPSLIDEIPVLAVLAGVAEGTTVFHGVGELRVKESDRLGLLQRNLNAVGIAATATEDSLQVRGGNAALAGRVETESDHRMAMAFAVAGCAPGSSVILSETASPGVSYPDFFRALSDVVAND